MTTPARLWLVRHGQTDYNLQGRIQGHLPTPLNATGRQQAADLARYFAGKPFAAIYSSDLPRAAQTAAVIAESLHLSVTTTPALRERALGDFEGKTAAEFHSLRAAGTGDLANWTGTPGVESDDALWTRASTALRRIAASHPAQDVLIVTHGGLMSWVVWRTLHLTPGSPRRFPLSNGITVILSYLHDEKTPEDGAFHLLSLIDLPLLFDHAIVPDTATARTSH